MRLIARRATLRAFGLGQPHRYRSTVSNLAENPLVITNNKSSNDEIKPPPPGASSVGEPAQFSPMTPLLKELIERIKLRGAIPVHEYMASCLTHPTHGYYSTQEALGKLGDFVTAPEISQTFGEMIGVWCVAMWQQMGEPEKIKLVEIGGGKGTLMKDILRTCSNFSKFTQSLSGITMVDASSRMRGLQYEALTGAKPSGGGGSTCEVGLPFGRATRPREFPRKIKVDWADKVSEIKTEEPVLIIAQELFDALPVHQFQYRDGRWCERLVDVVEEGDGTPPDLHNLSHHLRFVLSRGPTPAAKILLKGMLLQKFDEGIQVEIGSSAAATAQDLALIISRAKGAALIVDYGENHPITDSLRGIKDHQFVHPLREPGLVGLLGVFFFMFLQ
jgi:NADH dehydrogenase [ubiquinone] 1 alpha subcomplex assembly factor 7